MWVMLAPIVVDELGTARRCLEKRLEEMEIRGRIDIFKVGLNAQKNPGDLMKLAIT